MKLAFDLREYTGNGIGKGGVQQLSFGNFGKYKFFVIAFQIEMDKVVKEKFVVTGEIALYLSLIKYDEAAAVGADILAVYQDHGRGFE
jgi:hypothetical protein